MKNIINSIVSNTTMRSGPMTAADRRRQREARLDKVRARTAVRNGLRGHFGEKHGVNPRRIVLMDASERYLGGNQFTGRYVIKNKVGPNTKVNFS